MKVLDCKKKKKKFLSVDGFEKKHVHCLCGFLSHRLRKSVMRRLHWFLVKMDEKHRPEDKQSCEHAVGRSVKDRWLNLMQNLCICNVYVSTGIYSKYTLTDHQAVVSISETAAL